MQNLQFFRKPGWCALIAIGCVLLTACTSTTLPPPQVAVEQPQSPLEFPTAYYQQLEASGKKVLRVNPALSIVSIEVRRGGTLARLGHDHVIASRDVKGYVAPEEGRTDLYIPLAQLSVDEAELRIEAGFDTQPTPEAVEGTRINMLSKVLEADCFPFAMIRATRADASSSTLAVSITLHGVTRMFEVPAQIENLPGQMRVSGQVSFNQSDFGIVPYSILGGAMQVLDRLDLKFRIVTDGGQDKRL